MEIAEGQIPVGYNGFVGRTVLLVEDERRIRELVRRYLEGEGMSVLSTGSGAQAIELVDRASIDVVVLDLGLPDVPGEDVARHIRENLDVPLIMLTARSSTQDRIAGLELGADDYITKPFSPRELVLRVEAVLRRAAGKPPRTELASYGGGELVIDQGRRSVQVRGAEADLTPSERALLEALSSAPGRVFSRYELVNRIRGYEFEGYERIVDTHVKNLRYKIEQNPRQPRIVQTVLGAGYRLGLGRDQGPS